MEDIGLNRNRCRTCKHAFTTGKDRWYCKKSLADKDDCEEYKIDIRKFVEEHYKPVEDKPGYVWLNKRNMQIISIDTLVASLNDIYVKIEKIGKGK